MPACRCEGGASLWISQHARRNPRRVDPKLYRQVRARLSEHQLDQGRGVRIEDHRLCSLTKSETEPFAPGSGLGIPFGLLGQRTKPRRSSSSSGRREPTLLSLAIGLPRRVTTISSPFSTF